MTYKLTRSYAGYAIIPTCFGDKALVDPACHNPGRTEFSSVTTNVHFVAQ